MNLPAEQIIDVRYASDASAARQQAKEMSALLGFGEVEREEIGIAISELATNLFKHARGGRIKLIPLDAGQRRGIQIESHDQGSGFEEERALEDGFSTAGSLGCGLGAVNRLMDELDISAEPGSGGGTCIVCRRWLRRNRPPISHCPLGFGAASRPHPRMPFNGDSFVIKIWGESALAAVIDGLGHGEGAHRAAEAARHYVESHFDQPLGAIFLGVGRACRSTRGVVMALARFDWSAARLAFASIGNVEVRVTGRVEPRHFMIRRGILGGPAPNPAVTEHSWGPGAAMVMHSDGLATRWDWRDFPDWQQQPPAALAQRLLMQLAKEEDDATVVVIKDANR